MKRIAISFAALAVSAGAALAADLPARKAAPDLPPPPPPPAAWTGFYLGLNAGGTWTDGNYATVTSGTLVRGAEVLADTATGGVGAGNGGAFVGGGQIGYNWQFYNNFVAGIEADIQGLTGSGGAGALFSVTGPLVSKVAVNSSLDYIGTVRGRLGWLATPTLLLYGTGGLAYGGVNASTQVFQGYEEVRRGGSIGFVGAGASTFSDTLTGWSAGGGAEWMFWPNWSAKVEYLRYDLGSVNSVAITSIVNTLPYLGTQTSTRFQGNTVRAGLNYHLN